MIIDVNYERTSRSAIRETATTRRLAPREREVLDLLSKGLAYKQIAADMELSMGTIRTYIRRLYGKLDVNCRTEAVVKYLVPPMEIVDPVNR